MIERRIKTKENGHGERKKRRRTLKLSMKIIFGVSTDFTCFLTSIHAL